LKGMSTSEMAGTYAPSLRSARTGTVAAKAAVVACVCVREWWKASVREWWKASVREWWKASVREWRKAEVCERERWGVCYGGQKKSATLTSACGLRRPSRDAAPHFAHQLHGRTRQTPLPLIASSKHAPTRAAARANEDRIFEIRYNNS
jgi:hypothetical protein